METSAATTTQPETWHNLSVVYKQLGRGDQAAHALERYTSLAANSLRRNGRHDDPMGPAVRYMDADEFAKIPGRVESGKRMSMIGSKQRSEQGQHVNPSSEVKEDDKRSRSKLKWLTNLRNMFRMARKTDG